MIDAGIYIHLPFCNVKCMYCDFYSVTDANNRIDQFIKSLLDEIRLFKAQMYRYDWNFDTIFFGGGTPSLISPRHLEKILNELDKCYSISNVNEITLEVNPGEASKEFLEGYKSLGVNRLSIGFQSLNDNLLKFLGRLHSSSDALATFDLAREIGYDNINVDMIYDIPGQSIDRWLKDLSIIIDLRPEHICAYSLTVERGTKLYNLVQDNTVVMPDEETDISMFSQCMQLLDNGGYDMYEISNYAMPNNMCMHNLHYWNNDPYLAFGPSAHGHDLKSRWWNHRSLESYISEIKKSRLPISKREVLTDYNKFNEIIFNGLRLREGINIDRLDRAIDIDIDKFIKNSISRWPQLTFDNNFLKLNQSGIYIADEIASDLMYTK